MLAPNCGILKKLLWLVLGLALGGSFLFSACTSSPRKIARNKAKLWVDALNPPADAELFYEDIGIARSDERGCWAAYIDRIYGTDDPILTVLNYYDRSLDDLQDWIKNPLIVSEHSAVYDHPDGTSIHISTNIAYDFPDQFEKFQTRYRTLFYIIVISRPPDVREKCREY